MQSEPSQEYTESLTQLSSTRTPSPQQYGFLHDSEQPTPSISAQGDHGGYGGSSSEWSLSPASTIGSPSGHDAWLNPERSANDAIDTLEFDLEAFSLTAEAGSASLSQLRATAYNQDDSTLQAFPEEMLFHVLSHLPASDLLTMKLVSRHFYTLVKSPIAWMNAFSRFFPGNEALRLTADASALEMHTGHVRSERRIFTKLTQGNTWSAEYLIRTRLLRCLMRGKPSLPFAAPCPGKPGRGTATFTFNSRLVGGCTNLHTDFGHVLDKRKPQFIHGFSQTGSVNSSDRKGKFDSWGFTDRVAFRSFSETHPGYAPWGLGSGQLVGLPNVMDLSQANGVIYGEGTPGGSVFFLASDEKHGRYLPNLLGYSNFATGIPAIHPDAQSITSVWIAKSTTLARMANGSFGLFSGSSNGVVSSYSLSSLGNRDPLSVRAQVTARWVLSPGVPIIAILADDNLTDGRLDHGRVWVVALNALGELFYLNSWPKEAALGSNFDDSDLEAEDHAWRVGLATPWHFVERSIRVSKYPDDVGPPRSEYLPDLYVNAKPQDDQYTTEHKTRIMQTWLAKSPSEIRSEFDGWDMRRRIEFDFASDDLSDAGEAAIVSQCGHDQDVAPNVIRYLRHQHDWVCSRLSFGKYKNIVVSATSMDCSIYAVKTISEMFPALQDHAEPHEPERYLDGLPGQRARLLAAGTTTGTIFIWNTRAVGPAVTDLVNTIPPLRIIHTDSPGVSSLALSALYLVHGGEEGLVQAWDPLASDLEPIRTLSSRHAINNRRRAVIAAQQNPGQAINRVALSAGAICLDPDPTVLRGVVAIGNFIKYWSYSSVNADDSLSRSQKRRQKKTSRALQTGFLNDKFAVGRRAGLKGFLNQELAHRELDERDRRASEKEDRRIAGRFGMNLLGEDATEAEMLAYAKLLSEEAHDEQIQAAQEVKLLDPSDEMEVEAHKAALTQADQEKWKFASWQERLEMTKPSVYPSKPVVPKASPGSDDGDLELAIQMSLKETRPMSMSAEALQNDDNLFGGNEDEGLAEAFAQSLIESTARSASSLSEERSGPSNAHNSLHDPTFQGNYEDDLAIALHLSMKENKGRAWSTSPHSSPEISPRTGQANRVQVHSEDDFPTLSSSSPAPPSPHFAGLDKGKGRRKS